MYYWKRMTRKNKTEEKKIESEDVKGKEERERE